MVRDMRCELARQYNPTLTAFSHGYKPCCIRGECSNAEGRSSVRYACDRYLVPSFYVLTVISGQRFEEERNGCGILDCQSK